VSVLQVRARPVAAPPQPGSDEWLQLVRRARRLSWASLSWLGIEGAVSVAAGVVAGSVALVGFGIDSVIEGLASIIVIWRFTGVRTRSATAEGRAQRLVALSFFLLAPYIAVEALLALVTARHPEASPVGLALIGASLLICPWLGLAKQRVGARLGSSATAGEGRQNLLCAALAGAVLVGLVGNALWGLWWLDPAAALVIAAAAVREGVTSWRGESCGCCAPVAVAPVAIAPSGGRDDVMPRANALRVLRTAPVGCTLDDAALAARAEQFRLLADRALVGVEQTPAGGVRVRYRRDPEVEEEVARLAALESECCGTLEWRAEAAGDETHLVVEGPRETRAVLRALGQAQAARRGQGSFD
jgi:hypothetical protein